MRKKIFDVEIALGQVDVLVKSGDVSSAVSLLASVLKKYPTNKRVLTAFGEIILNNQGTNLTQDTFQIIKYFYLEGYYESALFFGNLLKKKGSKSSSLENLLGLVNEKLGKHSLAEKGFKKAIIFDSKACDPHNNLGNLYNKLGKNQASILSYKRALLLNTNFPEALNNLGVLYNKIGLYLKSSKYLLKAIKLNNSYAEAYYNLGISYYNLEMQLKSIECFTHSLQLKPDNPEALNYLGVIQVELGFSKFARENYLHAIRLDPSFFTAYLNYSFITNFHSGDPIIKEMGNAIDSQNLLLADKLTLHFALAKAYKDIKQNDLFFENLKKGNRIKKTLSNYCFEDDKRLFSAIKNSNFDNILASDHISRDDKKNIFIVGMPRSGSSLIHQILASHSKVYGAGELDILQASLPKILSTTTLNKDEKLKKIKQKIKNYRREINQRNVEEPFIVDKMPLNFLWLGFLHKAIPDAKFIHVHRNPIATSWSIYQQLFSFEGNNFSYDLSDIVMFYKEYEELMNFWREELNVPIYNLSYDDLVQNQEQESKELIKTLSLSWEEKCLRYYENNKPIRTASVLQVKEKIYQGSSFDWRTYKEYLGELMDAFPKFS